MMSAPMDSEQTIASPTNAGDLEAKSEKSMSIAASSTSTTASASVDDEFLVLDTPHAARKRAYWKRWISTLVISASSLCVTCTSSIYTSTYAQIQPEFGVSRIVAVVGLSVYVMGLGVGVLFLAPLSEFFGRRPIYVYSYLAFTLFLIPCALAPNIGVMMAFRFLCGVAGSAFLSVAGAGVGDMFSVSKECPDSV